MRAIYFLLVCSLFLTQSCTSNDEEPQLENDFIIGEWSIRNVSGGIMGMDQDFEEGQMVWIFDKDKLKVANLKTNSFNYGLENGTYSYKIEKIENIYFLYIDNSEFGGINLLKNGFIIDQNIISNGIGADGFAFKLLE